jgi:Na+/H+ antiporter NhaD/arsenite permease-like protein
MSATLAVGVFVAAYALIATEKANRVAVALTGAGLMLALGLVSSTDAFHSERFGIDWDVIFLLLGMMVIVGVIKHTGLFDYLAIWSAKRAGGRPFRILVTLTTITAVASALLDNVTTVLHLPDLRTPGHPSGAVPDRRGAGLQHRRHRHPDR